MKTSAQFVFYVSLLVTLMMVVLSYLSYRRYKEKEFAHLTEFWGALTLNTVVMGLFSHMMPSVVALSMVGWIWPLRTFRIYLEDISGATQALRWRYLALGAGAFITVALASYGHPFTFYTFPFAIAVALVGFAHLWESVRHTPKGEMTFFHYSSYALISLFFLLCLAFPFWRINPVSESYGSIWGLVVNVGFAGVALSSYLEITKRRHDKVLETILNERNNRLLGQSKYSELGMMSAGIAHEINNPLAVIQARTTQLLRIYRDENRQQEVGDGLQQILYTSERINRTIQGVREFVHQDEKGPRHEIELKALVDDILAFCGQRMKNHGINLRFYGLENFSVVGNKIQLEQVILNLLNNSFDAIEYLPDKWIEISAHQTGDKVQVYVKDSGNGIPPEIAARIMEPFYSTKDLGKGTGLGLALARGIAEKHGGTLQYLTNTAHTTFMLELPRELSDDWGIPLH